MSPRTLLAAAALALPALAPATHAQASFGLKAGLNVSDRTGDVPSGTDPRLGFSGGVLANLPIGYSGLYVQPEVLYSMKGVTRDVGDLTFTDATDYIEVPVVLGYATPVTNDGLLVGVYAGPSLGFKVREASEIANGNGSISRNEDVFKDFDLGAALGLTVGAGPFGLDGRYTLGLTNALDAGGNLEARNNAFTIAATYRFGGRSTARRSGRRY